MSKLANSLAWGKLTFIDKPDQEPILMQEIKFVIGRAKDCNLSIGSKNLSAHHCIIEKTDRGIFLIDTSANGCLINRTTKTVKGSQIRLKNGDEIHVVYKKAVSDVGFVFMVLTEECGDDDVDAVKVSENTQVDNKDDKKEFPPISDNTENKAPSSEEKEVKCDREVLDANVKPDDDFVDEIEQHLICSVCQDILHQCISLQPCMHNFCSGCYSEWMELSSECPECRGKVQRISPNHTINNLISTYLRVHPDKRRSDEDLKLLESKNKITKDMLYPSDKGQSVADVSQFNAVLLGQNPMFPLPYTPLPIVRPNWARNSRFSHSRHVLNQVQNVLHRPICRSCPTDGPLAKRSKRNDGASSTSSSANTSSTGSTDYVCGRKTRHLQCCCCYEYMPDRSSSRTKQENVPPQKCALCNALYCSLYWDCPTKDCTGCLSIFKDVQLSDVCLDNIIKNNAHESSILKNYLNAHNLTLKDVLNEGLAKLDAGERKLRDLIEETLDRAHDMCFETKLKQIRSDSAICKFCAYNCFSAMAYLYRSNIKDLPVEVASREDCYWGRRCRTQIKDHHAKKFNHICEQTRY